MTPEVHEYFGNGTEGTWRRVIAVDPGLGGTGCAYWAEIKRVADTPIMPKRMKLLVAKRDPDWLHRVWSVRRKFELILKRWRPKLAVIEYQQLWSGSAVSMASASSGDLFKLTLLTGVLASAANKAKAKVVLVTPGQWKGQLSKDTTRRRMVRAFGPSGVFQDHVEDAVGIGLAMQGRL